MSEKDEIIFLLTRMDESLRKGLEVQQQQLDLAQAQLERSNQSIRESLELQRAAVSRQSQIIKFVLPLIVVLLLLLGYVLVRWRIL